jgi:hypothetical protein
MGDAADMLLDGTCCQVCGEFMGDDCGYPRTCDGCLRDSDRPRPKTAKVNCGICHRLVKETGLQDHMRAKHNEAKP